MRKVILKSIATSALIIFAFVLGTLYPLKQQQSMPPTDIDREIINSCTNSNHFIVKDHYFYCFPAEKPKYSAFKINGLVAINS
jgi:hypothetical protein